MAYKRSKRSKSAYKKYLEKREKKEITKKAVKRAEKRAEKAHKEITKKAVKKIGIKIDKKKLKKWKKKAIKKIEQKKIGKTYLVFTRLCYKSKKEKEAIEKRKKEGKDTDDYRGDIRIYVYINNYEKAQKLFKNMQKYMQWALSEGFKEDIIERFKFDEAYEEYDDSVRALQSAINRYKGTLLEYNIPQLEKELNQKMEDWETEILRSFYSIVGFDVFDVKNYKDNEYNAIITYDVEDNKLLEFMQELGYKMEFDIKDMIKPLKLKKNNNLQKNLMRDEIRLDYDKISEEDIITLLVSNKETLKETGIKYIRARKTKKGEHIYIGTKEEVEDIYTLQMELGSDTMREELNQELELALGFYQNILFKEKHKIAYSRKKDKYLIVYTSKEAPAPFLTKKLKKLLLGGIK
jgi:hypothetical protein